ncbi:exodeoxyribonuclease VII small subunit [Marinicella gelatinilytica]|uniref:exodeoxyribonuclease VII small subunit n=1 Tax=Marinicella gelatinilytica TaxID=2996017 RepID=UPI0022609C74|nr:exodeoxyribonuclease VII small subunit [Marinicella gelatinilytica]MCX7545586.1 exodeoxyribonuclease VII small subunit [Marinicella gelatinilytica]
MSQSQSFEKKLAELNSIVEKMEQPEVGLEESLKLYEKGIALTRECQKIIDQAEQKISKLLEESS